MPCLVRFERIPDSHKISGRSWKVRFFPHGDQSRDECPFGADFLIDRAEGWRPNDVGDQLTPHIAVRAPSTQAANAQRRRTLVRCLQTIADDQRQSFEHCAGDMLVTMLKRQSEKRAPCASIQEWHALARGRKVR